MNSVQKVDHDEQFCKWEVCIGFNYRIDKWNWSITTPGQSTGVVSVLGDAPTRESAIDAVSSAMKSTIPGQGISLNSDASSDTPIVIPKC